MIKSQLAARVTRVLVVCAICVGLDNFHAQAADPRQKGQFVGELVLKDMDEASGPNFVLVSPFGYVDPQGVRWQAEPGLITDGASIPAPFWSIIGGPFEGVHRRAAIIHDYYCANKYRSWQRTHRVFYDALRTVGVDEAKAKLMYYAVWRFGPRWEVSAIVDCLPNPVLGKYCASSQSRGVEIKVDSVDLTKLPISQMKEELAALGSKLEKSQLSPEALESMAEKASKVDRKEALTRIPFEQMRALVSETYEDYIVREEQ